MNKAQNKIVFRWLLMLTLIIIMVVFSSFIQNNWNYIQWPAIITIIIVASFNKNIRTFSEGRFNLKRIIEENKWVKSYLIAYFFIIAIGVNYVLWNEIELNIKAGGLILILISFFLPIIIIQEKEAYINASK